MKELCVVPCGKRKIWDIDQGAGPTRARDAYIGPFVRKCIAYAEKFYPDSWCILSAKHGFLWPDDVVPGPYEVSFLEPKTKPIGTEELAIQIKQKGLRGFDPVVVLGGRKYADVVEGCFVDKKIIKPLTGCRGIGHMMHYLDDAISHPLDPPGEVQR
jgi:hypothetical protein